MCVGRKKREVVDVMSGGLSRRVGKLIASYEIMESSLLGCGLELRFRGWGVGAGGSGG